MRLPSFFPFTVFARRREENAEPTAPLFTLRHAAFRCAGCNVWAGNSLVYMSNGRDYCLNCAKGLRHLYGYEPAGRRPEDIIFLDEMDSPSTREDPSEAPAA